MTISRGTQSFPRTRRRPDAPLTAYHAPSAAPATTLAREAVDRWLRQQFRKARQTAIEAYAAEMAGTHLDLDPDLESAAIEHLVKAPKSAK